VIVHERNSWNALGTLALVLVLVSVATLGSAGEFKISRYIEPNQMSNLLTRHVRKGIIKRIGLSEAQLGQIRDAIDPHREKLLEQITEVKDARIDLIEAVVAESFDGERVRKAHVATESAELNLTLTLGTLIRDIRPILTEEQLREVGEMMEEVRESSEIRFADFAEHLAAGELLGLKNESGPRGK
jgi:Spy/CpxP family protein refolding chaperone